MSDESHLAPQHGLSFPLIEIAGRGKLADSTATSEECQAIEDEYAGGCNQLSEALAGSESKLMNGWSSCTVFTRQAFQMVVN